MNRTYRWIKVLSTSGVGLLCALAFGQAVATTGAVTTTDDPAVTQPCLNGGTHSTPATNCNLYLDKLDVWLSGFVKGPSQLGKGTYFFAVLVPGSQQDPNDGAPGNLSTDDANGYLDRTFTVDDNGAITNLGSHAFDSAFDIIQLAPYENTTNPGGVYILAVCQYTAANPSSGTGAPGV